MSDGKTKANETGTGTGTGTDFSAQQQHDKEEKCQSVTEGTVIMKYGAGEESAVFYNPVQVQNRDLSILMLTLFAERRAIRKLVAQKRKELRQENQGKAQDDPNRSSGEVIQKQLDDYSNTLQSDLANLVVPKLISDNQQEGMTILDALAASGLRSMRYWKEIPGVKHVTVNDLDPAAVERAHMNVKENELTNILIPDGVSDGADMDKSSQACWQRPYGICIQNGDAKMEMYLSQRPQTLSTILNPKLVHQSQVKPQWDVIDLDPYGSAAPFLDAAVQAIESGGMLCVTCTDMAALGGSHPETCYGRYASMPIPSARYLQEGALRILLGSIATTAAKYGRTIQPILSVGMDFYIRVFVEVKDDKAGVSKLSFQMGSVFQSTQCPSFHVTAHGRLGGKKGTVYQPGRAPPVPQCEETGADFKMGGPMWLGPLHDVNVVQTALERLQGKTTTTVTTSNDDNNSSSENISPAINVYPNMQYFKTRERLEGLLTSVKEELVDVPLYYGMPDFCRTLKCSAPPLHTVKAALLNAGYRVSGYHKDPQAVKTDAPNRFLWDILRVWCKSNPTKKEPEKDSPAAKILAVEPTSTIDFTIPSSLRNEMAANNKKGAKKVSRFPMNPEANWGPKKAASGRKRKPDER